MTEIDRKQDPIDVLRLDSLLHESQRYDSFMTQMLHVDKEHAVPLMLMAVARRTVGPADGVPTEQIDMRRKIAEMRELVAEGPEHVAAVLMCLAVELSLMMDRASTVVQCEELGEPREPS